MEKLRFACLVREWNGLDMRAEMRYLEQEARAIASSRNATCTVRHFAEKATGHEAIEHMVQSCEAGEFDVFVVPTLKHLGTCQDDVIVWLKRIKRAGVDIHLGQPHRRTGLAGGQSAA